MSIQISSSNSQHNHGIRAFYEIIFSTSASQDNNQSTNEPYIPELPTNCKFCGGPLPEERAFWGKRFCSKSCGKKYNASHSLRARRGFGKRGGGSGRGGRGRGFAKLRRERVCYVQ